jgi:serine/threonine protein kinase
VHRRSDIDIKLTDFGVAKNMTAEGLKTFCGTPQYFAPEVLKRWNTVKGDGRYGKEIDCWSIGVILFILLSGTPPFDVSAGFDAVANADVTYYDEQWSDVSPEARDLVERLLQKDPATRMSVKDACDHVWVLKEDGDTHCHPLSDPLIVGKAAYEKAASSSPLKSDEEETANLNEVLQTKTDSQYALTSGASTSESLDSSKKVASECAEEIPANGDHAAELTLNACSDLKDSNPEACNEPPKSNTLKEPPKVHNQKENRHLTILPYDNGKSVTKAISQAMDVSLKSPNPGSPIYRKKLFTKDAENQDTARKISKINAESIKAAGESLPKPVLQTVTQNRPKKEKGIHSYFAAAPPKPKNVEPPSSQQPASKLEGPEKKRRHDSYTITPPANEQLVFNLKKRIKVDVKHRKSGNDTSENREDRPLSAKAELSEDELQSDFSDAEDMEVADNTNCKATQPTTLVTKPYSLTQQFAKNKVTNITCKAAKVENRKIQSYLFGKPPPDTNMRQDDQVRDPVPGNVEEVHRAVTSDSKANGENTLERISSPQPKSGVSKGNQKSIKSWFLPKKN